MGGKSVGNQQGWTNGVGGFGRIQAGPADRWQHGVDGPVKTVGGVSGCTQVCPRLSVRLAGTSSGTIIRMWQRVVLWCTVVAVVAAAGGVLDGGARNSEDLPTLEERLKHARHILSKVPLVDGHNDLPMNIRHVVLNQLAQFPFDQDLKSIEPWASMSNCHTDLPRLREGQVGAQFWSAFVPCRSQYKNAVTQTLEQVDVVRRLVDRYPDDLYLATSSQDILNAHAMGKVACMVGVEGGHSMDSSLATLRTLYREGVRYMTLTHGCNTPWADNSQAEPDGIEFDGLTAWGEVVVKEMNRLGMLVDISHVASQTMRDVLNITRAPVIFSHSDTRALCNISRNIPDDVLVSLRDNGGVAMVNFLPFFLTCSDTATLQDVVAHINHIRSVAGVDHIGLGSDFDGITTVPEGLEDVSKYPYLFAELLLDPTWTDLDLMKLAGLNLIRAFEGVEQVRDALLVEEPWDLPIPPEDVADHVDCANVWP